MSPNRRSSLARPCAVAAVAAAVVAAAACGGGAGLGERCDTVADCDDALQCLNHICVPRCERHTDCGDGHVCRQGGVCELVDSAPGDACEREVDCGPGQSCQLADEDFDDDGLLTASCQQETPGAVLDDACDDDDACRSGTCALGRCVDLCVDDLDCPLSYRCSSIPRRLPGAGPLELAGFRGCLRGQGTLTYRIPTREPYEDDLVVPVPGIARSVAVVMSIDDPAQLVGAGKVVSPAGELLYELPVDRAAYFANRLRHEPTRGVATLLVPQTPADPLVPGAYLFDVGSWRDLATRGTEVPAVEVIYKLDDTQFLDLHFYFLHLGGHPCLSGTLDAATAADSPEFASFVDAINLIFANAGIIVGNTDYTDIVDRPDLDGLDVSQLGRLLELSERDGGVSVFFVRTLSPAGLQGLVGGPPSPPGQAGTPSSGVAIALDTLCYREWEELAETTAHEIARALGLPRSVEPDGFADRIDDNDVDPTGNLMYFSEFGGALLSPHQRAILRGSPALR